MIVAIAGIVCVAALFAQYRAQQHEIELTAGAGRVRALELRVTALESSKLAEFDSTAFDELKTKVEALRFAQGLRTVR